ncbi:MAG: hypothetical protein GWP59_03290 [Chlamydiales bacterium]|nr:hypothetical protein [Chlamydiales bacterium]NCF70709.1 hypothetical protein [Chlamydiales bacterium]
MKKQVIFIQIFTSLTLLFSSCEQSDNTKRYKGITRVVKKLKGDKEGKKPIKTQKPENADSEDIEESSK